MARPTVSIVMPSYNQARYLEEAIASIVAQRDEIHEFFVLDAGSDDGSREIIERHAYAIDDWRSEPDDGQASAIAEGFARATGDVINWINSDDAILPGAIRAVRDAFADAPSLGLVEGNTLVVDEHSRVIRCDRRAGPSRAWARFGYMRIHQPSAFFRRALYERVGGLDTSLHCAMDTDLWYRILDRADAARIDRYIGVHRMQPEAKGSHEQWSARYKQEWRELDKRYPKYRRIPLRHHLGRIAYHWDAFTTRRTRRARAETRLCSGKPIGDILSQDLLGLDDQSSATSATSM